MSDRFFLPHSRAFVSCKPRVQFGAALEPGAVIKITRAISGPYKRLHKPRPWLTLLLAALTCAAVLALVWVRAYS